MCPTCKKNTITRFGPYGPSYVLRWHFACQRLDSGCGYWRESNNPFIVRFIRSIGLEGKQHYNGEKVQAELSIKEAKEKWLRIAGLDDVNLYVPAENEAIEILEKEFD